MPMAQTPRFHPNEPVPILHDFLYMKAARSRFELFPKFNDWNVARSRENRAHLVFGEEMRILDRHL